MTDYNVSVTINPDGSIAGGNVVRGELKKTENAADRLRRTFARTFALLGGTALLGAGVRQLATFQQEMSNVRALTGATQGQFRALTEEAQRLGKTTRFSATQAAEGMSFLARAGFTAQESLESVEGTLLLAQAGALDLASAADIASNVLTAFRLGVDQTSRVVDVLAKTASSSNTDVFQLGDAMRFVAPVAAGLKVPLEEVAAAIASLSNAGLQASTAGTGLRRVLSELESPSNTTRALLEQLGLTTADVRVSSVGLTTAITALAKAGIDTGQALELFGDRGGPAFEVLRNSIPDVIEFNKTLEESAGTAKEIARIQDDNLNGSFLALRSAVQAVNLRLGEFFDNNGRLKELVLDVAGGFRTLADNAETLGRSIIALSTVALGGALLRALKLVRLAVLSLSAALLANPFTAFLVVLGTVIAHLTVFSDEISFFGSELYTLGDVAGGVFSVIGVWVSSSVEQFQKMVNTLVDLRVVFSEIGSFVRGFVNNSIAVFTTFGRVMGTIVGRIVNSISTLVTELGKVKEAAELSLSGQLGSAAEVLKTIDVTNAVPDLDVTGLVSKIFKEEAEKDFIGLAGEFASTMGTALKDSITGAFGEAIEEQRQQRLFAERRPDLQGPPVPADLAERGEPVVPAPVDPLKDIRQTLNNLQREESALLVQNSREREIANSLVSAELELKRSLSEVERTALKNQLEANQKLQTRNQILDEVIGREAELAAQQQALNAISRDGLEVTRQQIELDLQKAQLMADQATTFQEGFGAEIAAQVAEAQLAFVDLGVTMAGIFGPNGTLAQGISNAIAQSIVFGNSFKEALTQIGKQILVSIISNLVKIGIQQVVLATLGKTIMAGQTAASVAAAGTTAAAWSTPAALVSLASFGANAIPADAAMLSSVALAKGIATTGAVSLRDGGLVSGPGTGRSDSISANLSDGEFVVNAQSTAQNLPLLDAINSGQLSTSKGSTRGSDNRVLNFNTVFNVEGGSSVSPEELSQQMEERFSTYLEEQTQVGGILEKVNN